MNTSHFRVLESPLSSMYQPLTYTSLELLMVGSGLYFRISKRLPWWKFNRKNNNKSKQTKQNSFWTMIALAEDYKILFKLTTFFSLHDT